MSDDEMSHRTSVKHEMLILTSSDEDEDDPMDPHARQRRKQQLREKMIRLQEEAKDKMGKNEQVSFQEVAAFVKKGCSRKNFDDIRETLDGKQFSLDSNLMLTASKMVLNNMEHMATGGSARLFDPRKYAKRMASLASAGVRRTRSTATSSGTNPLLVDDEERPFEEKLLRAQAKSGDYPGLNNVEWAFMGRFTQYLLEKGPAAEFLTPLINPNDIMPTDVKTRRVNVRKVIKAEDRNVLQNKTEADNGKDEAAVSKELDFLVKALKKLFKEKNVEQIGYYQLAINPDSFAKTIENMFYLSTLLRDNQIRMELDSDGLPIISFVAKTERSTVDLSDPLNKKQAVLAFSYATWQQVKTDLKITKPLIDR